MSPATLTALGVRFLLEVTSLLLMGAWAASAVEASPWRWVAAVALALAGLGRPEAAVAFGGLVLVDYALLPARLRRLMGRA